MYTNDVWYIGPKIYIRCIMRVCTIEKTKLGTKLSKKRLVDILHRTYDSTHVGQFYTHELIEATKTHMGRGSEEHDDKGYAAFGGSAGSAGCRLIVRFRRGSFVQLSASATLSASCFASASAA